MDARDTALTPDQVTGLVALVERLTATGSGSSPAAHVALVVATTSARLMARGVRAELVEATEVTARALLHEPNPAGPQLPVAV